MDFHDFLLHFALRHDSNYLEPREKKVLSKVHSTV